MCKKEPTIINISYYYYSYFPTNLLLLKIAFLIFFKLVCPESVKNKQTKTKQQTNKKQYSYQNKNGEASVEQ